MEERQAGQSQVKHQGKNPRQGLVMVYTGNGKGKTTAALGLAMRAMGHGERVYMAQFMKGRPYGEIETVRRYLPLMKLEQFGPGRFIESCGPTPEDRQWAGKGLEAAREALRSGEYDLVILDEINVAVEYHLLSLKEVLELVAERPPHVDLVLTGRYARPELLEVADMVSEVREVKHHYRQGIPARAGVEF